MNVTNIAAVIILLFVSVAVADDIRIYDKYEGYVGRIDNGGNIYDKHEGYVGRIKGGCND